MTFRELFGQSFWALLIKVVGSGLLFLSTLIFARILGAYEFGNYSLALTVVTVLSVLSRFGLDNLVLKKVAALLPRDNGRASGYILSSIFTIGLIGIVFTLILSTFSHQISKYIFNKDGLADILSILSFAIIPVALIFLLSEALKSSGRPLLSTLLQSVLATGVSLSVISILSIKIEIDVQLIGYLIIFGYILSAMTLLYVVHNQIIKKSKTIYPDYKKLLREGLPMLLISSGSLILAWSDMVILGMYVPASEVGVYSAASRTVLVTSLILVAINAITAPKYAFLYKTQKLHDIKKLAQLSSLILIISVIFPVFVLLTYSQWIMSWFGEEYVQGAVLLRILTIGQLVNVACGSVGYLLSMTGKEKKLQNIMIITAVINIIFSLIAVNLYGVVGVAVITSMSIVLWNIWSVFEVRRHLGFWTFTIYHSN